MMPMLLLCPVCVGLGDGPLAHGANAGIVTLMAVTLLVLATLARVVRTIVRRSRMAQEHR
jgi:hypothetical protein